MRNTSDSISRYEYVINGVRFWPRHRTGTQKRDALPIEERLCIPKVSGRQDLNLRHPAPKAGALPNCATSRIPSHKTGYRIARPFEYTRSPRAILHRGPLRSVDNSRGWQWLFAMLPPSRSRRAYATSSDQYRHKLLARAYLVHDQFTPCRDLRAAVRRGAAGHPPAARRLSCRGAAPWVDGHRHLPRR